VKEGDGWWRKEGRMRGYGSIGLIPEVIVKISDSDGGRWMVEGGRMRG
jgi:hypothetical protein